MGSGSTRRYTPNFDGLIFISGFAWVHNTDNSLTIQIDLGGKKIIKQRDEAQPGSSSSENISGFSFTIPAIKGCEIVLTGKSGTTFKEFNATKIEFTK